jgi:transposase
VIGGESVRMIARRFTVSPSSIERHKKNHLAGEMAAVLEEQSGQRMSWLMEEWHLLRSETVDLDAEFARAEEA